jgi:phospholipid/cholesterol/gamma-HCH transport system substrate-binding protein
MRARIRTAVVLGTAVVALTACGAELENLPAPDALGSAPRYTVTAHFRDVENLTIGAKVKLEGAVIGAVTDITTKNYVANVKMQIEKKFPLAHDARFQIRFTTPLGEDFVAVASSTPKAGQAMANGTQVPLDQTNSAPTIEDTFAAVSTLLNGGGLNQIHIIASELQTMLHGRTGQIRDLIGQLDTVVGNLDAHKGDIDNALVGLQKLSAELNNGNGLINQALQQFPTTIQLLNQDTDRLTTLLGKVDRLGATVRNLLTNSSDNMATVLQNLQPTLDALKAADGDLIPTFDTLIRFGALFDRAAPGDYVNLYANILGLFESTGTKPAAGGEIRPNSAAERPLSADPGAAFTQLLGGGQR